MKQSLRLGTVSGIPVGIHWGLLAVAGLYLFTLATSILPAAAPGETSAAYWIASSAAVAVFFASILAHEIGHALVAQREGIGVRSITLWLLGGVAEIEQDAATPGSEFRIAAAGPAVSIAFGVVFLVTGFAASGLLGPGLVATTATWLGLVNLWLALFNLVPAAPLDGGRILTAALWHRGRSPHAARAASARVGQGLAIVLLGIGAFAFSTGQGFLILVLAWFLSSAATAERRRAKLLEAAEDVRVGDAMARLASPTDAAVTVAGLAAMAGSAHERVAFPVRNADGVLVGIVPGATLRSLLSGSHTTARADGVMVPWGAFTSARTDEPVSALIERLRTTSRSHALVYDPFDRPVGYLGLAQLAALGRRTRSGTQPPAVVAQ